LALAGLDRNQEVWALGAGGAVQHETSVEANSDVRRLTQRIAEMVGSRGNDWQVLTAGAFISMLVPLIVFFSLQRFFVRGLMAGSVKG